jgi:hypothetical protein
MPSRRTWAERKLRESPGARQRRLARSRAYQKTHKKEFRAYRRTYEERKQREDPNYRSRKLARGRNSARARRYKFNYGITIDEYDRMLARQHGRCAICKRKQEETRTPQKRLGVDHSHATRTVRELLCQHCNLMLGFAGDDANVLVRGAIYAVKHGGKPPLRKLVDELNRLVDNVRSPRSKSRSSLGRRRRKKSSRY